jgi:hypothetical protein
MIMSMLHMPFLHAEDAGIVVKCSRTGSGARTAPASASSSQALPVVSGETGKFHSPGGCWIAALAMFNSG